ncbi:Cytochrome oxidase complex assembly protein [Thalictrum thalictroides]|uniref:Cytochrome oxidase complex assembly protein n=1 Tax=Thalictrum thalictroides TaxID=46969 RepID=A0A7J6VR15_THATH|nr:Cytochrome oxidase complex assembly protein [Thalictrum thalictroides]
MLLLGRRLISTNLLKSSQTNQFSSVSEPVEIKKSKSFGRKMVQLLLLSLTGGVTLSALDDLSIYQGCSRKAMEKATQNKAIVDALGEPVEKGPWYNASLAVAHKRRSVSCTFPVSGPQGTGVFQLKAVRNGDDAWIPFLRPRDWDILIMDANLHVPANEESNQTFRINLLETTPSACMDCTAPATGLNNLEMQ